MGTGVPSRGPELRVLAQIIIASPKAMPVETDPEKERRLVRLAFGASPVGQGTAGRQKAPNSQDPRGAQGNLSVASENGRGRATFLKSDAASQPHPGICPASDRQPRSDHRDSVSIRGCVVGACRCQCSRVT